ncbi:hypothetical protein AB0P36_34765 [Streptomyces flavidovirens]|uniref:hypothetical protein n=1 Tax=Streptomyces flavidovirens TaxID=67298 RepID=UPI00341949D9
MFARLGRQGGARVGAGVLEVLGHAGYLRVGGVVRQAGHSAVEHGAELVGLQVPGGVETHTSFRGFGVDELGVPRQEELVLDVEDTGADLLTVGGIGFGGL